MPGGLLNLVAYGNQNIMLNGNPVKHSSRRLMLNIRILDYKNLGLTFKGQRSFKIK